MDNDVSTDSTKTTRQGRQRRRIIGGAVAAAVVVAAVVVGGTLQHSKAGTSGALGAYACPKIDATTKLPSITPAPEVDWQSCDLTGADLIGANLAGANLAGAALNNANLAGANLTDANLNTTVVTGANMRGVEPDGVVGAVVGTPAYMPSGWRLYAGTFRTQAAVCPHVDYTLSQPAVSPAPVAGVNWSGCDLHGAWLSGAVLISADLTGTDLTGANLTGASLTGAILKNTFLTRTILTSANLSGATLTGVKSGQIVGSTMDPKTRMMVGKDPVLPAGWYGGFSAYLMGPGADLTNADLSHDFISGALHDLTGANLTGVNLTGSDLTGVIMTNVIYSNTICFNGTNSNARTPQSCAGQGGGL